MKENITVSLLRNTSRLSISESKKDEQHENPGNGKINVWKTFKEAVDEEQEIVRKLYQTGLTTTTDQNSKNSREIIIEPKKRILGKTATAIRSNSSVSDIYRKAKAKLPKLQSRTRIQKDESIKILIKAEEKQIDIETSEFKKKMKVKRAALPSMPLEIYFNQDFQESSFISIANRPLPPLPKQIL